LTIFLPSPTMKPMDDHSKDCGLLIKRISDALYRNANNDLKDIGLTISQVRVLEFIGANEGGNVTLKSIGSQFSIAQPTVTGIVKRLGTKGLVSVSKDENQPRVKRISLTPKGWQFHNQGNRHRGNVEENILSPLSEEERRVFRDLLEKVDAHLNG